MQGQHRQLRGALAGAVLLFDGLLCGGLLTACGGNTPPELSPIADQRAAINTELILTLSATDADGDPLTFEFSADLPNIATRARLETDGSEARFFWTPLVSDIGSQEFVFSVSDEASTVRRDAVIEVAAGEGTAPVFVQPLGNGTTLDLRQSACVEVPVAVSDPDTPGVTLGQEEPVIPGAELSQEAELNGTWSWCPSKDQVAADDRYSLVLSADDFDNDKTLKDYLVVLRSGDGADCPGTPPTVDHTPEDWSSVNDLTILAEVTDPEGLKYEPLLYYSTKPPADPPQLGSMTQLTMILLDGDMKSGVWGADVPNPVATDGPGASAKLHYVIAATDNDDPDGPCDHTTQVPATGNYTIDVQNPGGTGGKALCESCTADVQCGDSNDLCIFFDNALHCLQGCTGDTDCPTGSYCSFGTFTSVNNAVGKQCVPASFSCTETPPPGCVDDNLENNDSLSQAQGKPPLAQGSHENLVSCPGQGGDDEDWYRLVVPQAGQLDALLVGGSTTDLDLALYTSSGTLVVKSDSLTSSETFDTCVSAGTYYLRVYAFGTGQNSYSLDWELSPGPCLGSCSDDSNEDDDDPLDARSVDLNLGTYTSTTQAICSGDEDWFAVPMFSGETLYASLDFVQSTPQEDLDLWIFDSNGVNLTGCDESTPLGCDPLNGQSGTSDEHMTWPIPTTGTYYVVVHGWAGSENLYDVCIGLSSSSCP
ncbi:MAG: pre-peptidase C-terminal domain-containing protein [Polyangiaceae bacterium]